MNNKGFHLSVSAVSKAKNHSVVAKSAYNSGSKLVDEQSGVVHDYTSKAKDKILNLVDSDGTKYTQVIEKNVMHTALITPTLAGDLAVTREGFWNDIERIETRKNAQLGTEIDVMFPDGITADQRIVLAERYAQTLSDRYNVLVDVAIHRPHSHEKHVGEVEVVELTSRNFHAHILLSSREIVADVKGYALSARKNWLQWSTEERLSKGLNGRGDELKYQRTLWADMANELLPENKTISEKSYRELGISRLPKMKLGKSLYKDILKGNRSVIHEYNETIDEINAYIEKNGLVIEYDDKGRIDLESNEQEVNGVTIHYKKRKPFARIELSNIRFVDPAAELEPAIPKSNSQTHSDAANDHVLDELLAISADFVSQKK
ncbi:MAG: MobA/MobL family protein, partial [Pseudomonadota bacterium]|nr:MobA/MobL family protein [Pseudomonadota bacterium]